MSWNRTSRARNAALVLAATFTLLACAAPAALAVAPTNIDPPEISGADDGSARVGQILTVTPGSRW